MGHLAGSSSAASADPSLPPSRGGGGASAELRSSGRDSAQAAYGSASLTTDSPEQQHQIMGVLGGALAGERSGASDAQDDAIVDWETALEHFSGDEATLRRLLLKFRENANATLVGLHECVRTGDMDSLAREANSLKTSSAYIAASRLEDAADGLAASAASAVRTNKPEDYAVNLAVTVVAAEQRRVLAAIEYKLARPSPLCMRSPRPLRGTAPGFSLGDSEPGGAVGAAESLARSYSPGTLGDELSRANERRGR